MNDGEQFDKEQSKAVDSNKDNNKVVKNANMNREECR